MKATPQGAKGARKARKGPRPTTHRPGDEKGKPGPEPDTRSDRDAIDRSIDLDRAEIGRPVQLGGVTEDTPDREPGAARQGEPD